MIVSGSVIVKSDKPKEVMDTLRATTEKWIKINSETSQWMIQFIRNILALDFVNDDQWSWIYYKMLNQKNHMMFFLHTPLICCTLEETQAKICSHTF